MGGKAVEGKRKYVKKNPDAPSKNLKEYVHDGVTYMGVEDVAAELGVSPRTILWHMQKYGHLQNVGERAKPQDLALAFEVCGVPFSGMRDMARKTGVTFSAIQNWRKVSARMEAAVRAYAAKVDGTDGEA